MPTHALNLDLTGREGYGDTPLAVLLSYAFATNNKPADPRQVQERLEDHTIRREALAGSRRRSGTGFGMPPAPSF